MNHPNAGDLLVAGVLLYAAAPPVFYVLPVRQLQGAP
jgi:hypothetical protein